MYWIPHGTQVNKVWSICVVGSEPRIKCNQLWDHMGEGLRVNTHVPLVQGFS